MLFVERFVRGQQRAGLSVVAGTLDFGADGRR
jgi:hypothetical protein